MIDEICIIGHPGALGGADTELDHQVRCWMQMGVQVHICPTGEVDDSQRAMKLAERGCIYHEPFDWDSVEGLHCISFCNNEFLSHLHKIRKYARSTTFVNCMSWNFEKELECQERGLLDFHLYQTRHSFERVSQKLKALGEYRPLFFVPYFYEEDFSYIEDRPTDRFRFGRISRDDADKYGHRQFWIYETMTAPVLKEALVLGWGANAEGKLGRPPDSFIHLMPPRSMSQRAFYAQCEAIIMTTDTFENLPRVGFEAMASGAVLVVDDRGGWKLQVEDGVTGWLCKDEREFVYKASRCAFEVDERARMRVAALERLKQKWGLAAATDSWAQVFDAWERLATTSPCSAVPTGEFQHSL